MRHISKIQPIAAFFTGPAARPRPAGRAGGASAAKVGRFPGRAVAGKQSCTPAASKSVDSDLTPSPSPIPPRATGERAARPVPAPQPTGRAVHLTGGAR